MPIFVELFFHCDFHGCESHAYVPGEQIDWKEETHRLPKPLPDGWVIDCVTGKTYCHKHKDK